MAVTGSALAVVLVGIGGSIGAMSRHAVGLRIDGRRSIVVVNALGSLALGGLLAAPIGSNATLLAAVGFCGAFTTFSSFTVETVSTADAGDARPAAAFAVVTLLAALAAFLAGSALVRTVS